MSIRQTVRLRWHAVKKWASLLWPRFCRYIVTSAQSPSLLAAVTTQATVSPWELTGFLNGQSVRVKPETGAKARIAYFGMLESSPTGWLELRQDGNARSRYVSPSEQGL